MFLIAIMLHLTLALPFWATFGTTALSELIIMTITAPIMYIVNTRCSASISDFNQSFVLLDGSQKQIKRIISTVGFGRDDLFDILHSNLQFQQL